MIALLLAYLRERVAIVVFAPAIALLTLTAVWSADRIGAGSAWIVAGSLVATLVLQFRLWDDLEDRDRDSVDHPDRLIVRSDVSPFAIWICAFALVAAIAAFGAGGVRTLSAVLALDAVALLTYRRIRDRLAPAIWRFVVLPLKYPAFVAIAASAAGDIRLDRAALAVVVTYLAAGIYEAVHTRVATAGVHP